MARIHPQTVGRFFGVPAWPFAYPIIITSDTSGEAGALRFTDRTRIFRFLDNQETENLGSFSDYSRETPFPENAWCPHVIGHFARSSPCRTCARPQTARLSDVAMPPLSVQHGETSAVLFAERRP